MSAGNITVFGSFGVETAAGGQDTLRVVGTQQSGILVEDIIAGREAVRAVADRITPYFQAVGDVSMLNSVDVAVHMSREPGYRVVVADSRPEDPLAFAFTRKLPPNESWRRVGRYSPNVPTDFVVEQFGVTWRPAKPEQAEVPLRYRQATNALLRTVVGGMDAEDNIYIVSYPGDTRDQTGFTRFGFQDVQEGVTDTVSHALHLRSWGKKGALLGTKVSAVRRVLAGLPAARARTQTGALSGAVVRPATSA
jgi:hypothetical protein